MKNKPISIKYKLKVSIFREANDNIRDLIQSSTYHDIYYKTRIEIWKLFDIYLNDRILKEINKEPEFSLKLKSLKEKYIDETIMEIYMNDAKK